MPVRNASTYRVGQKVWWLVPLEAWRGYRFGRVLSIGPDGLDVRSEGGTVFVTWEMLER